MDDQELLKQYYREHLDTDGFRNFNDLSEIEKAGISGMCGFAFFKAKKALENAKQSIVELLPKN